MEWIFFWRNWNVEIILVIIVKCLRFVRWSLREVINYEKRLNIKIIFIDDDVGDRDGYCDF